MTHFNLPAQLDILLKSASILRPKTTWYNLPNQLKAIKIQLLLANEEIQSEELANILSSITTINYFNCLVVANKIKIAINIIV